MSEFKPQAITDDEFKAQVIDAEKLVLVDFWAEWCGPCKAVAPVLEQLAVEYGDRVEVRKLDVDSNPRTAQAYGIRSIPTLMLFKGGEVVETLVGVQPKARLVQIIEERAA